MSRATKALIAIIAAFASSNAAGSRPQHVVTEIPESPSECRAAGRRLVLVMKDTTLSRDTLDELFEPHRARVATCQPQTGCWGAYGQDGYSPSPHGFRLVLIQAARGRDACSDLATALVSDPALVDVLYRVVPVRPDANCTCQSTSSLYALANDPIPGRPHLPPPKEKKPKRGQGTKEKVE